MKPEIFKNKDLLLVPTYFGRSVMEKGKEVYTMTDYVLPSIHLFFNNLVPIIKNRPEALLVIIDNCSAPELVSYLKTLAGGNNILHLRPDNAGKPRAINEFIAENIGPENLPRSVWSVDPDLLFDQLSFDLLAEAIINLPRIGLLGMRYKRNAANPELRTNFAPKALVGTNGKTYSVVFPFMANVAGPIMAITGKRLMETLQFKFFPSSEYHYYGHDDAVIYDHFKRRGIKSGYLNGTLATHLKSGPRIADELKAWSSTAKP